MSDFEFLLSLAPRSAPAEAREVARERLREAMAAVPAPRGVMARRLRIWAPAAAALLLAAGVSAWLVLRAQPIEASGLNRLATAVEVIPAEEFPAGAYWYTYSEERVLALIPGSQLPALGVDEFGLILPQIRETWLAADGSLRQRTTTGPPEFFDQATAEAFRQSDLAASLEIGTTVTMTFGPSADRIDPSAWPTDPDQLQQAMTAEATRYGPPEVPVSARLLDLASDLLHATGAQPDLRAAVLRVLARTEGLSVAASAEPGGLEVTVTYQDEAGRWSRTIGFDAAGNLITDIEIAVDGIPGAGVPPGTAIFQARHQPTTVVPEAPG